MGDREAVAALAAEYGQPGAEVIDAWVIVLERLDEFEAVKPIVLWRYKQAEDNPIWLNRHAVAYSDKDVFTSELAARNALEKRFYECSERLRKHREEMTRLLVRCADTMGGVK